MSTSTLLPEEQEAKQFLQDRGLDVSLVPTSSSRTPEFKVDGDGRGYLFEVKARKDSENWVHAMRLGRTAYQERSLGYGRWAADVARKAVKQFRSVDAQHQRWWVLWIAIRCSSCTEAMSDEAVGSLFGVRQVAYAEPHAEGDSMRDCLFATPGVFERHPEIVACIVDSGNGFRFCANDEFAGDFGSFRDSILWSSFARIHPPTTAGDLSQNRGFFRVDRSVNREDDSVLAAHLERTYGLEKAIVLDMRVHSASVVTKWRKAR
jgi:hypothetical protein